jgi:hypothetical protein
MKSMYLVLTQEESLDFPTIDEAWDHVRTLIANGEDPDEIAMSHITVEEPVISDEEFLALFV